MEGVSYQLTIAFGTSAAVTYEGRFTMAFVDARNSVLANLEFGIKDLSSKKLRSLRLGYTVGFGGTEIGETIRVAVSVAGQGPSPIFTRMRYVRCEIVRGSPNTHSQMTAKAV